MYGGIVFPGRLGAAVAAAGIVDLPAMRCDYSAGSRAVLSFPTGAAGADFTATLRLLDLASAPVALDTAKKIMVLVGRINQTTPDRPIYVDATTGAIVLANSGVTSGWATLQIDHNWLAQYAGVVQVQWRITLPAGATTPKAFGAAMQLLGFRDTRANFGALVPTPALLSGPAPRDSEMEAPSEPHEETHHSRRK